MPHSCLFLLAQVDLTTHLITAIASALGTGTILTLILRGFWVSKITPMIVEEIKKYADDKPQRDARLGELETSLHMPVVKESLDKIIHSKIDNEIKRSDGLISQEFTKVINVAVQALREDLMKIATFVKEDGLLKSQLLQRMAKLEGAMLMSVPSLKPPHESTPSFPSIKEPPGT